MKEVVDQNSEDERSRIESTSSKSNGSSDLPFLGNTINEKGVLSLQDRISQTDEFRDLQDFQARVAMSERSRIQAPLQQSYSIFIKITEGKTITINNVTAATSITEVEEILEEKLGIPMDEQYLIFGGKKLDNQTLGAHNITKNATLFTSMRLSGGMGEVEAIKHVISKNMYRGNDMRDILKTKGKSTVMRKQALKLLRDHSFLNKVRLSLVMRPDTFEAWLRDKELHIEALIFELFHAGNCGNFATVVQSRLVKETTNQYVHLVGMVNPKPDRDQDPKSPWIQETTLEEKQEWIRADRTQQSAINVKRQNEGKKPLNPKRYDHGLVVTYPTPCSSISEMDLDIATVADGWDSNMVLPLRTFVNGKNAYGTQMEPTRWGIDYPNLQIMSCKKADKSTALTETEEAILTKEVKHRIQLIEKDTATKEDSQDVINYINNRPSERSYVLFDMPKRKGVQDLRTQDDIDTKLSTLFQNRLLDNYRSELLDLPKKTLSKYLKSIKGRDEEQFIEGDALLQEVLRKK